MSNMMLLNEMKKQASTYLQDKYKAARMALTDATPAQLLVEEVTSGDNSWGPDAKTMTRISDAAHDSDDYCRIVQVLHERLSCINWHQWRQSFKTLVVLEFLLTHGPEGMFEEFHCDIDMIRKLQIFNYIDERGFNWGACMRNKSERILKLLSDEYQLQEARKKALQISSEIRGFGNLIVSPSSASSSSSSSSRASARSSFGSYFSMDSPRSPGSAHKEDQWLDDHDMNQGTPTTNCYTLLDKEEHLSWPLQENDSLIESPRHIDDEPRNSQRWSAGLYSRFFPDKKKKTFRSISDVGKSRKKIERQVSS